MNKILVIDLEASCWDGDMPKGMRNEVIEIGICELDLDTGNISKNKGILINNKQSNISEFCTNLTTITQSMIDEEGVDFEDAIDILQREYDIKNTPWCSFGKYDFNQLKKECQEHRIDFAFSENHVNVKDVFLKKFKLKRAGLSLALRTLNLKFEGQHHRGVDDVVNIAKVYYKLINQ